MPVTQHTQEPVFGRRARWCVDPDRLEIRFSVGLMGVATVEGRFGKVRGKIVLDEGSPHRSRMDLSVEAASIDTRNPVRDFHPRTKDYLHAKQFPRIVFENARVSPLGEKTYRIIGDLTIREVTREISLDAAQDEDTD